MTAHRSRREFLTGLGGVAMAGLAGCAGSGIPGTDRSVDRTLYVGAYHWGFVLLDETGTEREQVTIDVGSTVKFVGFSLGATEAVDALPAEVRDGLLGHEELEARNDDRIPAPSETYLHEALEDAERRYPNHSLVIVPAGSGRMGGGMMDGGMMGRRGLFLSHDASEPTVDTMTAGRRGSYTIDCGNFCGYGHRYMNKPAAITVR